MKLTRAYKKRLEPTSNLKNLCSYLEATRSLLAMILQIPPFDPSTSLRTTFLLRLTNDVLSCIPGYTPTLEEVPELADWLDDLDQAWVVVLRLQVWDPCAGAGVVVDLPADSDLKTSPMSQTEKTRLKSLLIGGMEMLEEQMEALSVDSNGQVEGVQHAETLTASEAFNDLFSRTSEELGMAEEKPSSATEVGICCA
ncbi:hypothetical protein E1B28_002351 [Marasmius oreades]|uniref:Uncharacterized protein n=1 Tax=Marasmius oreades TaxID=181124 RepID=A0A9P7RMG6_9AGAR|nr:uncharacterized protein E1B28_002351 [Marasmius oreades]KAG7086396.1 hypothetical protein E1B28_002351 [Marasmius oreades]